MKYLNSLALAAAITLVPATKALAEWKPAGPIKLMIGFKAGGGTDTQARLVGEELAARKGWKFIYKNVAGKGGANLARVLKTEKNDGLTIGMAINSTFAYAPLISKRLGYTPADFDYLLATAPSQMGLVVRADSGWKTIEDMVKSAKSGKKLKFSIMTQPLGDAAYLIGKKFGIQFNRVKAKGGRGVLNGLMANDVDVGFIAGIHVKAVKSGDLINLASAEATRLTMSPSAPTLREMGIPYDFGLKFIVAAPKGMPADAKKAITDAFVELLKDENSKARKFIVRAFGAPPLTRGAELEKSITDWVATNKEILAKIQ